MTNKEAIENLEEFIDHFQTQIKQAKKANDKAFDIERAEYDIETFKIAISSLKQEPCSDAVNYLHKLPEKEMSCDRNVYISNEYNGIGCNECICNTGNGTCQREDIEEAIPVENPPCEEKVSIGVLRQVMWERDVAIKQLNEIGYGLGQKMWIDVKDFLPEERENPITMDFYEYPCTYKNGDVCEVRYYKFGDGHWWHGPEIMDEYVTAWMPVPEPYTESEVTK